jgi:DNA-binding response OmpR family regulator
MEALMVRDSARPAAATLVPMSARPGERRGTDPSSSAWPDDVTHLRWPAEGERRQQLARRGSPRLLHVEADADLPDVSDELEDWVRSPADAVEVAVRASTLSERYRRGLGDVWVDEHDVFRAATRWVALSPTEAALARALVDARGAPLGPGALRSILGADAAPASVRVTVHRLRRRLESVGVGVRSVRGKGLVLERPAERA